LKALKGTNWMASYEIGGQQEDNRVWSGNLPRLAYERRSSHGGNIEEGTSGSTSWLEAATRELVERIKQTNKFTFKLTCVPENAVQRGPARILSVSRSPKNLNIGIGQEGTDLIVQLRTPITGNDGSKPEMFVPEVFGREIVRSLLITFDGSEMLVYVDGSRHHHSLFLGPGAALFSQLVQLKLYEMKGYDFVYYSIVLFPSGILLALMFDRWNGRSFTRFLFIGSIGLLFVASMEFILARVRGGTFLTPHMLFGILVVLSSVLLVHCVIGKAPVYQAASHRSQ
jgi:hypothetical protein